MSQEKTAMLKMIDWLQSFNDSQVKPTYTNMLEKAWQLRLVEDKQIDEAYKAGCAYMDGSGRDRKQ